MEEQKFESFDDIENNKIIAESNNEFIKEKKPKLNKVLVFVCLLFAASTLYFALIAFGLINFNLSINYAYSKPKLEKGYDYYKENYEKLDDVKDYVIKHFYKDISDNDFEEAAIRGVFASLDDPYSAYFNKKEFKEFMEVTDSSYTGLGVAVSPAESGYITVMTVFEGSPADKSGIKQGDEIIKVNGVPYGSENMDIAISKIKGKEGTYVDITIKRKKEEIDLHIMRKRIVLDSVKSEIIDEDKKIGYIRLISFDTKIDEEFKKHYETLKEEGMKGFVLDLRSNPGGSLRNCVNLTDYILGKQRILSTKSRSGKEVEYSSDERKIDLPFVVLIDGASASASEILASAIQDSKTAKLVGEKTFGKGVVQSFIPLDDGTAFKLTTSEYFTSAGNNIHGKGVKPDVEIKLSDDYEYNDKSTDNQLQKAIEVLETEMNK